MQRPRRTKNSELLNRISRLETIVGNVNIATLNDADLAHIQGLSGLKAQATANETSESKPSMSEGNVASPEIRQRMHSADSPASKEGKHSPRYMGNDFWVNLVGEVEGLKQALAQSTDSDTEDESMAASPDTNAASKRQTFATQGLLASYSSPESTGSLSHPPNHHVDFMVDTYFKNVDPILKILHRPTILKMISDGTWSLTQEQEALQFAIYFAAVTSMTPEECVTKLGKEQKSLFKFYQIEVERALAATDYLNNSVLECLQAFLLYVACLRVHNDSRASWVLTAMLLRLAQAYNLIQDGDGSQHTPYEAEMRRRLWWQVVVLDIRASGDRGTEAMIDLDMCNTRLPLNINDDDFSPESTAFPPERTGGSDVTFSLCAAESSSIFLWVGHAQARFSRSTPHQSEEEIVAKAQRLEQTFILNHDANHYQSALAAGLVRLITLKLWLFMQYPIHLRANIATSRWPKVSREAILQTAVGVMELHEHKHDTFKKDERFRWWAATYVQWHPLAVALAELCVQTRGPLVERAWKVIETVYPNWALVVADSKRGALWRPIRKLYKKSKGARAAVLRQDAVAKEQAEAFQRLDLIAEDDFPNSGNAQGGMGPYSQLPQTSLSQQQPLPNINLDAMPAEMDFRTAMDFNAPTIMGDSLAFDIPALTPSGLFTDTMTGWPDNINFDMPMDNTVDPMNWTVWNEFIDDTNAIGGSRAGSSEDG